MSALLLGFALCGAASAAEVTIWHAYRGDERAALESLAERYTRAHPQTQVVPVFVPYGELGNKAETAVPRGNGPDLFVYAHERLADWATMGVVLPVTPATTGLEPGFLPLATDALTHDGSVWGWPLAAKCLALFWNRALVDGPPADTDALVARASALTEGERFGLVYEVASAYTAAAWMHGFGGGVFGPDGAVALDRTENRDALAFVARLAGIVPPDTNGAMVTELFNAGRAAYVINGPWFLGDVAPGVDYGVAPLPTVRETGRPAAPYATVEAIFLAREGADARAVGAWLAGPEAAAVRAAQGRQLVARRDVVPDDPALRAFHAQLATAVPMPTDPAMARTWEPLARALRRLVRGVVPPSVALAEAASHYAVITRPPAPPADPRPWLAAAGLAAVAGVVWAARELRGVRLRDAAAAWAWVAPSALALTTLVIGPFVVGAAVSLFETQGNTWHFTGVTHFLDILLARDFPLSSPLSFWYTLAVTLLWTSVNLVCHVGVGMALAMLLREPWVRLRGVFRAVLILPWAIPSYITALVWKGMFHRQFGAINGLLSLVGVEPVSWFERFATAFAANVITNTWLGFPFMMVVTLGALQSIPRDLEEAAAVDGANGWTRFRHVTLPLLLPALAPAVVLGSVWTFNAFNVIYLVSGGEPDGTTDILVSQAYRWAFTRGHRYGYAAAYAVIIFGVLVLWGQLSNRLLGKRVL